MKFLSYIFGRIAKYRTAFLIAVSGIAVSSALIEQRSQWAIENSLAQYTSENSAMTQGAAQEIVRDITDVYYGLRVISRFPSLRSNPAESRELSADTRLAVNEVFMVMDSFPAVKEVRVVSYQPADPQVVAFFGKEWLHGGFERLLTIANEQYAYFERLFPNNKVLSIEDAPASLVPLIDESKNSPVDALIYSVPFFSPQGKLAGLVVATLDTKAIRFGLPNRDCAITSPADHYAVGIPGGTFTEYAGFATKGLMPKENIYSDLVPLNLLDAQNDWYFWTSLPSETFFDRPDVQETVHYRIFGHIVVFLIAAGGFIIFTNSKDHRSQLEHLTQNLEGEVKHKTTELVHAHKMESIGQLAAGIAHEINTPTQYIGDNVHFLSTAFRQVESCLQVYDTLTEKARDIEALSAEVHAVEQAKFVSKLNRLRAEVPTSIGEALEGIHRVKEIVRSMKDYSHPGGNGFKEINLNRLIESTVTISRSEWREIAEVKLELQESIAPVECNSGEVGQVLLNLLVNAAHAIKAANTGTKGEIVISSLSDGDKVAFRVSDTGCGIPDDKVHRIFDQFYTTKEIGEGTGMGLAIVEKVVKSHNGTIHVESAEGIGTIITISLPKRHVTGQAA